MTDALVLSSVCVKTLDTRKGISKLYQLSGSAVFPTAYMILCVRSACLVPCMIQTYPNQMSATDSTLDTGGWLVLTRRGLAPRKMHQASLGAANAELSRPGATH